MAKEKKAKPALPNKNVHLRLSFLHQAATYLANNPAKDAESNSNNEHSTDLESPKKPLPHATQTRHLLSHMKGVSRKSVIRLNKEVKRRVCKGCDQLLADPSSTRVIENKSKRGAKPWADVLVVKCNNCGTAKRFPVGAEARETKKPTPKDVSERKGPITSA